MTISTLVTFSIGSYGMVRVFGFNRGAGYIGFSLDGFLRGLAALILSGILAYAWICLVKKNERAE